ncbi:MAG TPA: carboxylesterase family protein, partial [Brevundimonas sp.]|nr:carboxylesterase family protein [Brevundimonas sp.]
MTPPLPIDRRGALVGGLALCAVGGGSVRAQSAHPVAPTTSGPVRGRRDAGVAVFKGVRYGADTGPRRFQPPVAPAPWAEPVDAFDYGPACPQTSDEPNQSEDCLFLNVWTPGLDRERRPVMVYIHGGGYATGSGSSPLYDGIRLALPGRMTLATMRIDVAPEPVIAAYREMYPHYSPSEVFFAATTAARSWRAAIIEAEARAAAGTPAFVYQLDWISPIEGGRRGAQHTDDIPLAFDNVGAAGSRAIGPEAQPMADRLSRAFVAIARSGVPNHAGLPAW